MHNILIQLSLNLSESLQWMQPTTSMFTKIWRICKDRENVFLARGVYRCQWAPDPIWKRNRNAMRCRPSKRGGECRDINTRSPIFYKVNWTTNLFYTGDCFRIVAASAKQMQFVQKIFSNREFQTWSVAINCF